MICIRCHSIMLFCVEEHLSGIWWTKNFILLITIQNLHYHEKSESEWMVSSISIFSLSSNHWRAYNKIQPSCLHSEANQYQLAFQLELKGCLPDAVSRFLKVHFLLLKILFIILVPNNNYLFYSYWLHWSKPKITKIWLLILKSKEKDYSWIHLYKTGLCNILF